MTVYFAVAALSYLLGSIPFGYILVRVFLGSYIRQTGSGNIGATNVGRTGHKGLAIATLLLDAGKGAGAVLIGRAFVENMLRHAPPTYYDTSAAIADERFFVAALAALFAVLGHVFTVWLKFRGGKGVATAVGAFALLSPVAVLAALAVFLVTLGATRYVSLGSILGAIAFPISVFFLQRETISATVLVLVSATSALVILKHHENIRRLFAGTENKIGKKPASPANPLPVEKRA